MKKILLCGIFSIFFSQVVYADKGIVIKDNVCNSSNYIIETTDGWYIALEHVSGSYLSVGDKVFGKLKTSGYQEITKSNGSDVRIYIEDYESNIEDALDELCN